MQSFKLAVVLLALFATPSWARIVSDTWEPPSWYHGHEGPRFQRLKTQDDIDQRQYPENKWVATNITGAGWDDAYKTATERLEDYWKGNNDRKQEVDRTVPTFTMVYPTGEGQVVQSLFSIAYFVPQDLQDPPAPTAQELAIVNMPQYNVWVKVFGGFASEKDILEQGFGFMDQLRGQGVKVRGDQFGVAIYDDLIHLVNRHNEIWVWEEQAPSMMQRIKSWFSGMF